jgi:hypothetical protein
MSDNSHPVLQSLRHLNQKFEGIGRQLNEFNRSQADGEEPDPGQFMALLQQESVTRSAMMAQFNLLQKPLKTVLSESR